MPKNMPLEEGIRECKNCEDEDKALTVQWKPWVDVRLQRIGMKLRLFVSRVNTRADKLALEGGV